MPNCSKCWNHDQKSFTANESHSVKCEYKNCACKECVKIDHRRKGGLQRTHNLRGRQRNLELQVMPEPEKNLMDVKLTVIPIKTFSVKSAIEQPNQEAEILEILQQINQESTGRPHQERHRRSEAPAHFL